MVGAILLGVCKITTLSSATLLHILSVVDLLASSREGGAVTCCICIPGRLILYFYLPLRYIIFYVAG